MIRLFVVLLVVFGVSDSGRVDAGGLFKRRSRSGGHLRVDPSRSLRASGVPSQFQAAPFGLGASGYWENGYAAYGYIDPYAYDPYLYGSFEMQDPADDPYLRHFYRYDTFFPGRRSARRTAR